GTRFGYAVQLNAVDWIADALRTGDANQVDDALTRAATLDGSFVRAVYEHHMDEHLAHPPAAQAASLAKQQQMAMLGDLAADPTWEADVFQVWLDVDGSGPAIAPEMVSAAAPSAADHLTPAVDAHRWVPELHLGSYERTFLEHTHAAAGSRDYTVLVAAHAADADATPTPGEHAGIPRLRPYDEVRNQVLRDGDGALVDEVTATVRRSYDRGLDLDRYDQAWERAGRTRYEEMFDDAEASGGRGADGP
ncbi:MAG TPA: hypothetical protein VK891_09255, partial [Euzebyales bacterium]|nr:hypothetical protein [Euzebyales bacterium]